MRLLFDIPDLRMYVKTPREAFSACPRCKSEDLGPICDDDVICGVCHWVSFETFADALAEAHFYVARQKGKRPSTSAAQTATKIDSSLRPLLKIPEMAFSGRPSKSHTCNGPLPPQDRRINESL
jgi:hypothetical protein